MVKPHASSPRRSIAIACGGTAGHVYPALAVAEAYENADNQVDLLFIGTASGWESRLLPQHGHRFEEVQGSPLFGVGAVGKFAAVLRLVRGTLQARRLLKVNQTKLVIGLGGYASAGALLAARSLGLKTAVHETNIVPGMTNRYLGCLVDRVYLGFEASASAFPTGKTLVTGNPVRPEVTRVSRTPPRECSGRAKQSAHILVTGGSGGSSFLNENTPSLLAKIAATGLELEVRHQVGDFDSERVRKIYENLGIHATVSGYIEDMGDAYRWADFAVVCSGAGTLSELAVAGLPALLVPLNWAAGDHQAANAVAFAAAGGGMWVREDEWQADALAPQIAHLLQHEGAWQNASEGARRLATSDAAHVIVADCEAMMAGQW